MAARIQEESVYLAVCADCDWYSTPHEDEQDADREADEHNEENHS